MDPRKLLYFASVVESGSFNRAAKRLAISQPALSTSIGRLEHSLGQQLLNRGPTGVTPTPLGELLYAHARMIRDELTLAENRLKGLDPGTDSWLAFGTLPSLATSIVPKGICRWRENHARHTLRVVEKIQLELLLSLMRGEVEFIVAQTEWYGYLEGLMQRVLFRDRLYVISRPEHPASQIDNVSWQALAKYPWIIQMIGRQRTLLEKLLTSNNAGWPQQLTECGSVDFIKSLVASSDSLAMLPASAVSADVRDGRIRPIDIVEPLMHRDIAVIFRERSPLSAAARELVSSIAEAGMGQSGEESAGRQEQQAA